MSSHHIIREDQEPALVIDTADAANFELIQQLLEWSPTVVVNQSALEQVLLWGIKIDVAIVEEKRVEEVRELLRDQLPVRILSCADEAAALETVLYFLTASKQKTVNIISDSPLETFEKFTTLELAVIQQGRRWILIRSGRFDKWLPQGSVIDTYPDKNVVTVTQEGNCLIIKPESFWVSER